MMTPLALMLWMDSTVSTVMRRTFASMMRVFASMCSMTPLAMVVFSTMRMGLLFPSIDYFPGRQKNRWRAVMPECTRSRAK
ncbi:hypothetical protein AES38_14875 (plasmid) [Clavibacter capsici]|nr:hypothetical protein AES38_14875 [Clavibacter capsici]